MRILWFVPKPLPVIENELNIKTPPTGGWLSGISNQLIRNDNTELGVCFAGENEGLIGNVSGITYYVVPKIKEYENVSSEKRYKLLKAIQDFNPDAITVFGTEHSFQSEILKMLNASEFAPITSVWIQGLVGVYYTHYKLGIPERLFYQRTPKEWVNGHTLKRDWYSFARRGENERQALSCVRHVFGRTEWDKAITKQCNPKASYHFCNETLREEFYNNKWSLEKCHRHAIFVSQCQTPIKGFHFVLKALEILKKEYPDVKLYTTGRNLATPTIPEKLRFSTYEKYLNQLIYEYGLHENVFFLGTLSAKEMCMQYINAHVFVSASSIENSPNSLGEAMILGVPVVSSYVGGVAGLLKDKEEGFLYQADAPYMLAEYVKQIFDDDEVALRFSKHARKHALDTHNREKNCDTLIKEYEKIAKCRGF